MFRAHTEEIVHMNELFIILFFTFTIPLLIWGLFGLVEDIRYWFTYDK